MRTSRELAAWIAQGERGPAADTIVEHLTGIVVCAAGSFGSYPRTLTELRHCILLFETVPTLRTRLSELTTLGPEWSVIVEHWRELEELFTADGGLVGNAQSLSTEQLERYYVHDLAGECIVSAQRLQVRGHAPGT